jgi:hypothetical protein
VLVAAAKEGQAGAFAILVKRHERTIFFAALRITPNREDAEDVGQQGREIGSNDKHVARRY